MEYEEDAEEVVVVVHELEAPFYELEVPSKRGKSGALIVERGVRGNKPRQLDQFFTSPAVARKCVTLLQDSVLGGLLVDFDLVLEPSFGAGAFLSPLEDAGVTPPKLLYFDIDAKQEDLRKDFLTGELVVPKSFVHPKVERKGSLVGFVSSAQQEAPPPRGRCLTIGNPPFGKNSSLAVSFFNRAAQFSDVIAFVLPRTFCKSSVKNKLDRKFLLAHEEKLESDSFVFKGDAYDVPSVFQTWVHVDALELVQDSPAPPTDGMRALIRTVSETEDFTFVKANSSPDLAIRRVGVNAGRIFQENPSACSEQSHHFIKFKKRQVHQSC